MGFSVHFDYILKNDNLQTALAEAEETIGNFLDNE
jgi:hypothetical protein